MEYSLTKMKNILYTGLFCLNPYSNGILSDSGKPPN